MSSRQQIENEIAKYSMQGDWRIKEDKEIIENIVIICKQAKFARRFIEKDVYEWIHIALCNHQGSWSYFNAIGKRPLDLVAENAVRNICNRLFK